MSKNDFCRCCKNNLRIHGELTDTISIFERNSKDECTYERIQRLWAWLSLSGIQATYVLLKRTNSD